MTPSQQFLQDMLAGQYRDWGTIDPATYVVNDEGITWGQHFFPIERFLLDPLAWQAAGRTRGWQQDEIASIWRGKASLFFKCKMEGKSGDEALAAIEKGI